MQRTAWISMLLLAAACNADGKPMTSGNLGETGAEEAEDSVSETGSPDDETTSGPVTSGIGGTEDGDGTTGGAESDGTTGGCNFLCPEETGGEGGGCDHWAQDCPDGEKCSAYADNGGTAWNNTKCVDVAEDPDVPGSPCTVEGNGVSGIDSCELGAMCWDVDPNTGVGVCVALCTGNPEAPVCDAEFACAIANDVLNLCLNICDPLTQNCPGDDLCIPNNQGFLCVLDASGEEGQAFDPCVFGNACDKGLFCMDPGYASECDPNADGCCLPFCDVTAPDCPGVGQQCLPWYEPGTAPPDYENVGICGLMM